ncbi:MAG: monoamine oxidase [Patiriisocius sp.]|jgi:monoamine oxidase
MKRRKFILDSAGVSLGIFLSPSMLLSSCGNRELFEESNFKGTVLIIGAGAAGLYAGYILKSRGIDFKIIEASNKIGGRIGKLSSFSDLPLDTGAQWLHGKNSIVGELIQKTKTKISKDNSDVVFWYQNKLVDSLPQDVESLFQEGDGLPDVSFKDYATQNGFGTKYDFIVEGIAGDQGADANLLSVAENFREEKHWTSGEHDYKFHKTYSDLFTDHIVPEVVENVILNAPISKIDYSANQISASDNQGNTYRGNKVIITVPITILQDGDIEFIPPLHPSKKQAFDKIGMGAGMKVFLKFSESFYDENIIGGEVCAAYTDEKEGKDGNDNILLAFVMGHQAENLTALGSDEAIAQALLAELDEMYKGQASQFFLDAHVEDWTSKPFVRGAYSYSTIGIGNSRSISAQTVSNKLFFAGEAMNLNGHHQTVHGAVETAYREVSNILKSVSE